MPDHNLSAEIGATIAFLEKQSGTSGKHGTRAESRRPLDLSRFSFGNWLKREIPPPECLLGHWLTTAARVFLSAPTGLGKTNLALAMAAGMATGRGFGPWKAAGPTRTLVVDGEMPRDLIMDRLQDLARRNPDPEAMALLNRNLLVISMDDFPEEAPFNTEAGRAFMLGVVAEFRPQTVFFDNRMSLTEGEMKDEQPWRDTLPLVTSLTRDGIAQVWIDHTGHEASRTYGTLTKIWRVDAAIMLSAVDRPEADLAFKLEFTKARRRKPDNRADFEPIILTLTNDVWTVEAAAASVAPGKRGANGRPLGASSRVGLDRLNNEVAGPAGTHVPGHGAGHEPGQAGGTSEVVPGGVPGEGAGHEGGTRVPAGGGFPSSPTRGVPIETFRTAYYDAIPDVPADQKRKYFSRMVRELTAARLIGVHQDWVWPVHQKVEGWGGTSGTPGTFVPLVPVSRPQIHADGTGTGRDNPPIGVSRLSRVPAEDGVQL